jgi:hypothetical protein
MPVFPVLQIIHTISYQVVADRWLFRGMQMQASIGYPVEVSKTTLEVSFESTGQ